MNNKKTFHEVSEIWCDAKRPIVKHSTLCAYQLTLQTHYCHDLALRKI